jgi:phosphohistidine phosphatase
MKTLTLVRHAKSSWDNEEWTDLERPLNERGFSDAPMMADIIANKLQPKPDLVLSSNAQRALSTANIFAQAFGYNEDNVNIENGIYDRGTKYIINFLKTQGDDVNSIMLFGHNPDVTSMATYFLGNYIESLPTCAVITIDFDIEQWAEIEDINGVLKFYEYPKRHRRN